MECKKQERKYCFLHWDTFKIQNDENAISLHGEEEKTNLSNKMPKFDLGRSKSIVWNMLVNLINYTDFMHHLLF